MSNTELLTFVEHRQQVPHVDLLVRFLMIMLAHEAGGFPAPLGPVSLFLRHNISSILDDI